MRMNEIESSPKFDARTRQFEKSSSRWCEKKSDTVLLVVVLSKKYLSL